MLVKANGSLVHDHSFVASLCVLVLCCAPLRRTHALLLPDAKPFEGNPEPHTLFMTMILDGAASPPPLWSMVTKSPKTTLREVLVFRNVRPNLTEGQEQMINVKRPSGHVKFPSRLPKQQTPILKNGMEHLREVAVAYDILENPVLLKPFFNVKGFAPGSISLFDLLSTYKKTGLVNAGFTFTPWKKAVSNYVGMLSVLKECLNADKEVELCTYFDNDMQIFRTDMGVIDLAPAIFQEHPDAVLLQPPSRCHLEINRTTGHACDSVPLDRVSTRSIIVNRSRLASIMPFELEPEEFRFSFEAFLAIGIRQRVGNRGTWVMTCAQHTWVMHPTDPAEPLNCESGNPDPWSGTARNDLHSSHPLQLHCTPRLAQHDVTLPEKSLGYDDIGWNLNFEHAICALEHSLEAERIVFYYPVEDTLVTLMRFGRSVGALSSGVSRIPTFHNALKFMLEIPNGQNVNEAMTAMRPHMMSYGYTCGEEMRHSAFFAAYGSDVDASQNATGPWGCRGNHKGSETSVLFFFYQTVKEGGNVYARLGDQKIPLQRIRDYRNQTKMKYCAFLPSQLRVPCPIYASELTNVRLKLGFYELARPQRGKNWIELPPQPISQNDAKLKEYADMLDKAGVLSFKHVFDSQMTAHV